MGRKQCRLRAQDTISIRATWIFLWSAASPLKNYAMSEPEPGAPKKHDAQRLEARSMPTAEIVLSYQDRPRFSGDRGFAPQSRIDFGGLGFGRQNPTVASLRIHMANRIHMAHGGLPQYTRLHPLSSLKGHFVQFCFLAPSGTSFTVQWPNQTCVDLSESF